MNLTRLIYISDATKAFSDNEIFELNRKACENNQTLGVTGRLLYAGKHFMQVLEGEHLHVTSLYAKIERDSRHAGARQLMCKKIESRLFPVWGMELINFHQQSLLDRERIEKILIRLRLSDGSVADDAIALLREFRSQFKTPAA